MIKKRRCLGIFVVFSLLIVGVLYRNYVIKDIVNEDSMLEVIQREVGEERVLRKLDYIKKGENLLVIAVAGEKEQELIYYVAEFSCRNNDSYMLKKTLNLVKCGWKNFVCRWGNGYVFICDNKEATQLQIDVVIQDREIIQKSIEIEKIPWIYYIDRPNISEDYIENFQFLNEDGATIL